MKIRNYKVDRGLKIRTPFIDRILAGDKTMEVRGQATRKRGRIALIRSGTDLIVGTCDLVDVVGPYTREELAKYSGEHCLTEEESDDLNYERFYGWMVENVEPLNEPIRYARTSGPVIWAKL